MVRSLFVTGTDTDAGKTVVTAAIASAWRGQVRAVKPVMSGATGVGSDAWRVAVAAGHEPLCFASWSVPVSPHRAAILERRPLDLPAMLRWLDALPRPLLVEGVGGWRVPLRLEPRYEVADLARHLGFPVIVVAADRLGVLNHTLLTVDAVRRAGLPLAGVVLDAIGADDASIPHNLTDLRRLFDGPVVPFPSIDPDDPVVLRRAGEALVDALFPPGR